MNGMKKTTPPKKVAASVAAPALDAAAAKAIAAEGDELRRGLRKRIKKMWTIPAEERQARCR